jgi:hypothetical protein
MQSDNNNFSKISLFWPFLIRFSFHKFPSIAIFDEKNIWLFNSSPKFLRRYGGAGSRTLLQLDDNEKDNKSDSSSDEVWKTVLLILLMVTEHLTDLNKLNLVKVGTGS